MMTTTMTKRSSELPPEPLPGMSSVRLIRRGILIMSCGGIFVVLTAPFESDMGRFESVYVASACAIVVVLAVAGWAMLWCGNRKQLREYQRGYAARNPNATKRPDLWVLDYRTLKAVRPPEPIDTGTGSLGKGWEGWKSG